MITGGAVTIMITRGINTTDAVQEDIVVSAKHRRILQSPSIMRRNRRKYNHRAALLSFFDFFLCCALL